MSNRTTAPIVAFTIEPTMPTPRWMPNFWKQPASNEGTDNSDNQITNETKTGSAYKLASQPACNYADNYYDQKTFARHVHRRIPLSIIRGQVFAALVPSMEQVTIVLKSEVRAAAYEDRGVSFAVLRCTQNGFSYRREEIDMGTPSQAELSRRALEQSSKTVEHLDPGRSASEGMPKKEKSCLRWERPEKKSVASHRRVKWRRRARTARAEATD